ncbi:MAG: LpxL/LpxP family Kdo(2)-lipid IV(A) lauroyl/palmitoleoyl acyltransferase [bacterium]
MAGSRLQARPSPESLGRYITPRYWPQWLGIGVLWLLSKLPLGWHPAMARIVGNALRRLSPRRERVVDSNLAICFPEISSAERTRLKHAHYQQLGMMLLDLGVSWWSPASRLDKLADIQGLEHLLKALEKGKGAILLTSHMTSMELGGQILAMKLQQLGHPMLVMYKSSRSPLIENLLQRGRLRFTDSILLHRDIRGLIRGVKRNLPVWYAPDQDFGAKNSVFAPFFGTPAATLTMTSRLASTSQAPVLSYTPVRSADGKTVSLYISEPLEHYPSGDDVTDAETTNHCVEEAVKLAPEQYFWIHRRFKTRPEGMPSIY